MLSSNASFSSRWHTPSRMSTARFQIHRSLQQTWRVRSNTWKRLWLLAWMVWPLTSTRWRQMCLASAWSSFLMIDLNVAYCLQVSRLATPQKGIACRVRQLLTNCTRTSRCQSVFKGANVSIAKRYAWIDLYGSEKFRQRSVDSPLYRFLANLQGLVTSRNKEAYALFLNFYKT